MRRTYHSRATSSALFLMVSALVSLGAHAPGAAAAMADGDPALLLGTFEGTVTGQDSGCPIPADNRPIDTGISITFDELGSARGVFATGDMDRGDIRADIDSGGGVNGQAQGSSPDGSTFNLSFSGSLEGGRLYLSGGGSDSSGCMISVTIMADRVANAGISQASTPSEALIEKGASDTQRFGNTITNIVRGRRSGGGTGVLAMNDGMMIQGKAAGSGGMMLGAWAGYSRTSTENDFAATAFKDHRHDLLFGIDTTLDNGALVGVAFGIQSGETKTGFNGGEQNLTAITVAPYIGMLLTDWLSFDATAGVSDVQIDQSRISAGTGAVITSDVESMRYFANLNLAATKTLGNLLLTGLGGISYATQSDDTFTESGGRIVGKRRATVGRFLIGGEASYAAGAWEPYARALYEYDYKQTRQRFAAGTVAPRNDDDDVLASVGLRYYGDNGVSGSVEYSTLLGRRNLDEDSLSANVRWEF